MANGQRNELRGTSYGALFAPPLWAAFAVGFGGSVVDHGRFDLTGANTGRGIEALVQLARQFGGGVRTLRAVAPSQIPAEQLGLSKAAAMFFTGYGSTLPSGYRWARFPKLPVHPVIPVTPSGVTLIKGSPGVDQGTLDFQSAPDWELEAVVAYARCVYSVDRNPVQHPGLELQPPPLADASAQTDYWSSPMRAANGGTAVGDWRQMEVVEAGWPPTGRSSSGFLSQTADIVAGGLTTAVLRGGAVTSVLSQITEELNAAATQERSATKG